MRVRNLEVLVGWRDIATNSPFTADTLRKNYRERLVRAGVLFYSRMAGVPRKRPCAIVDRLKRFWVETSI